jgi:hypothetical protein
VRPASVIRQSSGRGRVKATLLFAHAPLPTRSAVVGELDEDLDANLDLSTIMAAPLKTVFH